MSKSKMLYMTIIRLESTSCHRVQQVHDAPDLPDYVPASSMQQFKYRQAELVYCRVAIRQCLAACPPQMSRAQPRSAICQPGNKF